MMPERPVGRQPAREDRSLGELFAELMGEVTTLVRQEITLAKVEMGQNAAEVGKNLGFLAAGGAVAYAGLLTIIAAIVIILDRVGLPLWASALLVGLAVAGVGGFLVMKAINGLKKVDLAPRQTIETLKEDAEWLQDRAA